VTRSGLPRFDAYIFDLDGTIYVDDELIPGADHTIARLRAEGARVAFVTNNPLHPATDYADRLTRLGIPAAPAEIVTSIDALVRYLDHAHPGATVLPIAEAEVCRRLTAAGYALTDDAGDTDVVVVAFDRTFTYAKLLAGYRAVRERRAPIVATNPDPFCPTRDGGLPDCAAMLAALEACTGTRAEAVVGKPSHHMVTAVLERLHVAPEATAVVGDRPATDVAMGRSIGATAILVLSGATSAAEAAAGDVRPDHTLDSIRDLIP
jgi:HAD superfamily hydrolase (TIGR01450 family)